MKTNSNPDSTDLGQTPPRDSEEKIIPLPVQDYIRSLQFIETELNAHIELGGDLIETHVFRQLLRVISSIRGRQANETLSKEVDNLKVTVNEVARVLQSLLEGAEAQIAELSEHMNNVTSEVDDSKILEKIEEELQSLCFDRENISTVQEEKENHREDLLGQIKVKQGIIDGGLTDNPRMIGKERSRLERELATTSGEIVTAISAITKINNRSGELIQYREALKLVKAGSPFKSGSS